MKNSSTITDSDYRLMVESVQDYGIFMLDASGVIVTWNAGAEKIKGYKSFEIIGKHFSVFYSQEDQRKEKPQKELAEAIEKGRIEDEGPRIRKDGSFFWAYVIITALRDREGQLRGFSKVTRDVTESVARRKLDEQRADKLQELATILTQTEQRERARLAQILHDNLQQMLVAAKINLSRVRGQLTDAKHKTGAAQVDKLLDESIEASRQLTIELSPPVLRDAGLVQSLDWLGRWMKEKHGLDVHVQADADVRNPSEDQKVFLFQTIKELLFNIVKHAGTAQAWIKVEMRENFIDILVEDRGKGFDAKKLDSSDILSTGFAHFGLFNIRERLEIMGGTIEIESQPGRGSVVKISILLEEVVPSVEEQPAASFVGGAGLPILEDGQTIRILVADDHKILRQGLIHALNTYPMIQIVGEAENGQEAVEKALMLEPDFIIMDITMPKMNGIEATRRIKQVNPKIKIIGLSLHEAEDMERTMLRAGASKYLTKSGPIDELIGVIRALAATSNIV